MISLRIHQIARPIGGVFLHRGVVPLASGLSGLNQSPPLSARFLSTSQCHGQLAEKAVTAETTTTSEHSTVLTAEQANDMKEEMTQGMSKEKLLNKAKEALPNMSKQELADLLCTYEIPCHSTPVRKDFLIGHPLTTAELEAINIHVYHRTPESISDHVAYRTVKLMRVFADAFFRKRYVHRAIVLETVAGVPGMVAGMFCHLKSLRRMENDNGGWIEKLLNEAENERMHLMIWMQVTHPSRLERLIVTLAQGVFWNLYALVYLLFPRTAHRLVGYLEEEAIHTYNSFAEEIRNGKIENSPAPKIAIDYYHLEKDARLLDVVYAVRADEAAHRDTNHHLADRIDAHNENLSNKFQSKSKE